MDEYKNAVEEALKQACHYGALVPEDGQIPQTLGSAMSYSLLSGGKRLRPVLLLASYHMVSEDWQRALPFAAALEMIHTYSLIHDDLPAMDNDDLRRGRPTNHKVFGEGVAVLAGDGLLNLAYETMLKACLTFTPGQNAVRATETIARRAGVTGMVAGQSLDVTMEGKTPTPQLLAYIHTHKTADLLTAPVEAGLMLAGATEEQVNAGRAFGLHLGLTFQIMDDLLDLYGDEKLLGKRVHVDEAAGKMTWPALYGAEQAQIDAKMHLHSAVEALAQFGSKANFLRSLAEQTLSREK